MERNLRIVFRLGIAIGLIMTLLLVISCHEASTTEEVFSYSNVNTDSEVNVENEANTNNELDNHRDFNGVEQVWSARFNGVIGSFDTAKDLTVDDEGNVYVVGNSAGAATGTPMGLDIVTVKYDSAGNQVWSDRYNSTSGTTKVGRAKEEINAEDEANGIAAARSGNVYVIGQSFQNGNWNYVLLKYDASGHKIGSAIYYNGRRISEGTTKILLDDDENIYVSGTQGFNLLKYNSDGKLLWEANAIGSYCFDMAVDGHGDIYLVGERATNYREYAVAKFNSSGKKIWETQYHYEENYTSDIAMAVAIDKENNAIVTGTTDRNTGWATVKYDSRGEECWVATFNEKKVSMTAGIAVDEAGCTYVCGWVRDDKMNSDILTVKYDPEGNMLWKKIFDESGADYAYDMAIDKDGNVYVTGSSSVYKEPDRVESTYVTIKYDSEGNQKWVARSFGPITASASAITLDRNDNVYVTGKDYGETGYFDYGTVKYSQFAR